MAKLLPIAFNEALQLSTLNINPSDIVFKNVSLQSGKYVTVNEASKGNSIAIIDIPAKTVLRLPVTVDSGIMHPSLKYIALRSQSNLQIYNLEQKSKIKTCVMNDTVVYWKWLNEKIIAIVTDSSVYHWSLEDTSSEPKLIFQRAAYEGAVQIINYRASQDMKWLLLGGIAASSAGGVVGVLQVYSVDLKASQPTMDAHAACFAHVQLDGKDTKSQLFCFTTKNSPTGPRLNIIEVGVPKESAFNKSGGIQFSDDKDFPVSLLPDNQHGMLFILTKMGYLMMYEISTGKLIFSNKASQNTMFASVELHDPQNGVLAVDQTGRVAQFSVDEKNIVQYITQTLNDYDLGIGVARKYNLPGAEGLFKQQFQRLIQSGRLDDAIDLAAQSPHGVLRNVETIQLLKTMDGGKALLTYFQSLLKRGKLNSIESIELSKLVLAKGAIDHIKGWLKEQKLEASEELGDLLRQHNVSVALSVYLRANVPEKVIGCFLSLGASEPDTDKANEHFKNIFAYATRVNFTPDYTVLLQQLIRVNTERAKDLTLQLLQNDNVKLDMNYVIDLFVASNDIKSTTNILLEYLKSRGDNPADGELQSKLFEINLLHSPAVADAIFDSSDYKFTHYDRQRIGQLCERAQLYQRALEHYTELTDIKRVLANAAHLMHPDFILEYFGRMTPANCLDCIRDLIRFNPAQNMRLCVEVAKKWSDYLTSAALISLFEEFNAYNGIFYYLQSFVDTTDDSAIVFKYIEAAIKLDQLKDVERICRDNVHYDPVQIKEYLLQLNLKDPRPLIHVCDRYGYVNELTTYLYTHNMYVFIEAYIQRMNSKATPEVVGSLIDLNVSDDQIVKLIANIRPPTDDKTFYERLVGEVEKRNRLKVLKQFLELRLQENNTDPSVHNGLAKLYVDTNSNPTAFLTSNQYYDSSVVGAYCESRDPHLSFIAYKRAYGVCDNQLINVCNKNGFFKDLARYLVERQDLDLWGKVLTEDNVYRRQLIDQVVATALPESRLPEEVSTTVKAFMSANLPNELMELLERIILHGPTDGEFQSNRNLQNLLILTAIKADKKRVMDYVKRLNNYDGPDIAKIAISDQYQLYEEAYFIYKKYKKGLEAVSVLVEHIDSIERAVEFATYWDQPDVYSFLGKALLDRNDVKQAITYFLKSVDATYFVDVIAASKTENEYEPLIQYLLMCRTKIKDSAIDNELIYAYAKLDQLDKLEELLSLPTTAKLSECADICFHENLYMAARILYTHTNNNSKLAVTLVRLKLYSEAVEAARKANNILTWKEICFTCVHVQEFRLAQICAMHVIVYMDHMMDLISVYERYCYFTQVIAVFESGINLDRVHQGMYTQLGMLYAKYQPDKLLEHIKLYYTKLNIPQLLIVTTQNLHWNEVVFLYTHYDQYDNAIDTLIQHSPTTWKHSLFKEILLQCSNTEIYYRAIHFYLQEHPTLLNDLLLDLSNMIDHTRVVGIISQSSNIMLIDKYLQHVQKDNVTAVNDAQNDYYVSSEQHRQLRQSIELYSLFDQIQLAQQLEQHELLEFRRISAYLYRRNKRYDRSIEISKTDELWQDAMETTKDSGDSQLAESLLMYFVEKELYECWAASLYTCYDLIRPDIVLEQSWRYGLHDFCMPYMIQTFRQYDDKLKGVVARMEAKEKAEQDKLDAERKAKEEKAQVDAQLGVGPTMMYSNGMMSLPSAQNYLALPPAPGQGYGQQQGYGQPQPPMYQQQNGFY